MLNAVWILPAVSGVAFAFILFFGKRMPFQGKEVGLGVISVNFVLATIAAFNWINRKAVGEGEEKLRAPVRKIFEWYSDGKTRITVGWHVDGFAVAMLFVVAFISLMVHIFSWEYMRTDSRVTHYYAALSLFTGAMFLMVIASSTLELLVGWELMGLCSFLLIGHWWEEQPNTNAALKAFFTTRTGDIGLLVGLVITFFLAGRSFDIQTINERALGGHVSHLVLLVAAIALFGGVVGKSAQFPFHTWLPDAMAGPTPASSLIHAATMVVAGVYLFARLYGVFWQGFSIHAGGMNLGAWTGSITLVMAAGLAFVQTDIKKVLAYSTVSQLGYMVMGLSVGAWTGAIFHLFTHAFFKALLFQGAGSISHSGSHHSFEMERMGGLRKYMPWTFGTFAVGSLALAGIIPFAGFWSKDEILLGAHKNGFNWAFAAGAVGAFMTGCYMMRVMWKVFFGENRLHLFHDEPDAHAVVAMAKLGIDQGDHGHAHDEHGHAHDTHAAPATVGGHGGHDTHDTHDGGGHDEGPHESNWWILGPLVAMAVAATIVFLIQLPGSTLFGKWTTNKVLQETVIKQGFEHKFSWGVAGPSLLIAAAGILVGYLYNAVAKGDLGLVRRFKLFRAGHSFLKNKYYLDVLWTDVIIASIKGPIAKAAYWFNQNAIDGVLNWTGKASVRTSKFVYEVIDQKIVDGAVNGAGASAGGMGGALRKLQTGRVQNYAALFIGAAGLAALGVALFT